MNKVYGGTPLHNDSKCLSCRYAQIVRGLSDSSERIYCRQLQAQHQPVAMRQPVISCNLYDDKRMPSHWDMEQIAWVLVTNKAGKAIGFVSAEEFKRKDQHGVPTFYHKKSF